MSLWDVVVCLSVTRIRCDSAVGRGVMFSQNVRRRGFLQGERATVGAYGSSIATRAVESTGGKRQHLNRDRVTYLATLVAPAPPTNASFWQ